MLYTGPYSGKAFSARRPSRRFKPNEVDVFELARVLESFGNVLKESYKVTHPGKETELNVGVEPFQPGSFIMDIALHVQQNPGYLLFLSHPEIIDKAKETLEYLGFIKKIGDKGLSLLELVKKLKGEKPEKVDKKPDGGYEYKAKDGSVMPVDSEVHHLYNNSTVNHYTYNIFVPAEKESVEGILTSLRGRPDSARHFGKEDVAAGLFGSESRA